MNRDWVLAHLREASEELTSTIAALEASPEYDHAEFWVAMQHLYHHVNTAWNARDAGPDEVAGATDRDFTRWSKFPVDLPMMEV